MLDILNCQLYSGYYEYPRWDVPLTKGKHEPIVSMTTWQQVQYRLSKRAKVPVRSDIRLDFPLRGFVLCHFFGNPLTSCWSKGRKEKYPYYICHRKDCDAYGKSIKRDVLEGEFEDILQTSFRRKETLATIEHVMLDTWQNKCNELADYRGGLEGQRSNIERKIDVFIYRIADTDSTVLVVKDEKQIMDLEQQRIVIDEKIKRCSTANVDSEKAVKTAHFSLPFKLSRDFNTGKSCLVRPRGLEPPPA